MPHAAVLLILTSLLFGQAAHAEFVSDTGATGSAGAAGGPGLDGGIGAAGGDATATAGADEISNHAEATAGAGGDGGDGGPAPTGGLPGSGGAAGAGGDARAVSTTSQSGNATTGGTARAGQGGTGGLAGGPGAQDGDGGRGGDATMDGSSLSTNGDARSSTLAVAGRGGDGASGGRGGDAIGTETAQGVLADSNPTIIGGVGGNSNGRTAGAGGNAFSSSGATGEQRAASDPSAQGGSGGSSLLTLGSGADGGDANAVGSANQTDVASGSTHSFPFARTWVSAFGGRGGEGNGVGHRGGHGGSASGRADASAAGQKNAEASLTARGGWGGNATNGARGGDGASITLDDAVSGSSPSLLRLEQRAIAGSGGSANGGGLGGQGGDAMSRLSTTNPGLGDTAVTVTAEGGDAGGGVGPLDGGQGVVRGHVVGAASRSVDLSGFAAGGNGSFSASSVGGDGGAGLIEGLEGIGIAGGDVRVVGTAAGGSGGRGSQGGAGGDATIVDAVSGSTSGLLTLEQRAQGGEGGGVTGATTGPGGDGGEARSSLDISVDQGHLDVVVSATAGLGGSASSGGGQAAGGKGGDAEAVGRAFNSAGDLKLHGGASGGSSGSSVGVAAQGGGSARSILEARTVGDGNDISVATGFSGPVSARGGNGASTDLPGSGGVGGAADAQHSGIAAGNSKVLVRSKAEGGQGGGYSGGSGGRGGIASATSLAQNAGGSSVEATAEATGGDGGRGSGLAAGDGGVATAKATANSSGGGLATARATVRGGDGGDGVLNSGAGRGGDAILRDAVSGSTTGDLNLFQTARGGDGGSGSGGHGGNSISSLDAENLGGGNLTVQLEARGGSVGTSSALGGDAHTEGSARAVGDVDLTALSVGGAVAEQISPGAPAGGVATVGPLFGESTGGGKVNVKATVRGGGEKFNGSRSTTTAVPAVRLVDAVDGKTTGDLVLEQHVFGSGSLNVASPGDAETLLTRSVRSRSALGRVEAQGGTGIVAGLARAEIDLTNHGLVSVSSNARGNLATRSSDPALIPLIQGGNAIAVARGASTLDGTGATATSTATGGDVGQGGSADARSSAVATKSRAQSTAFARGARGDRGGDATADAHAKNTGSQNVTAKSTAVAGAGTVRGGRAIATASGESATGQVDVTARAESGAGVSSDAIDAVSGSTAGGLTLHQTAVGGKGDASLAAGDASSVLDTVNRGGGSLHATSEAIGGGLGTGQIGGNAVASITADDPGSADVFARAIAEGGDGGGVASLGRVYASSAGGGDVHVVGHIKGGAGSRQVGSTPAGPGVTATLVDSVDGHTSGHLTLEQIAEAGSGGAGLTSGTPLPGDAGDAESALKKVASGNHLTLHAKAFGGHGSGDRGTGGGRAVAHGDASSDQGISEVLAEARGGRGGWSDRDLDSDTIGGSATVTAVASSSGDGHEVRIGKDPSQGQGGFGAFGGIGGRGILVNTPAPSRGGDASSSSVGTASGDSRVSVFDVAVGGAGGTFFDVGGSAQGGRGGDATSSAVGSNTGSSSVSVEANATGGIGGGRAMVSATGSSVLGDVQVKAVQRGGKGTSAIAGADSDLINVVTGSTSGKLTLIQEAIGGDSIGGGAGDASSSLTFSTSPGGGLDITSRAKGGENGGSAVASAVGTDAHGANLTVQGIAEGGFSSGQLAPAGSASLGRVYGSSSAGGSVDVQGTVNSWELGPNRVSNAIDGDTSGRLSLSQIVQGPSNLSGAGLTESILQSTKSNERLAIRSEATGADASASSEAFNRSGDVVARSLATGQSQATASTIARATIDGARVEAGAPVASVPNPNPPPPPFPNLPFHVRSHGAIGEDRFFSAAPAVGADATSQTQGLHDGDGEVLVYDFADAGDGSNASSTPDGSNGGNAMSDAYGRNRGVSRVAVTAEAFAGSGGVGRTDFLGNPIGKDGVGGSATARATAEGLGRVQADASAHTGFHPMGSLLGPAVATATGLGSDGLATAEAGSLQIVARARTGVRGQGIAEARVLGQATLPVAGPGVNAFASAIARPGAANMPAFQGQPAAAAAVAKADAILALGRVGFSAPADPQSIRLEAEFDLPFRFSDNVFDHYELVSTSATGALGGGILRVVVELSGTQVLLAEFTSVSDFLGRSFALPGPSPTAAFGDFLRIRTEWLGATSGSTFGFDFLLAGRVPEPRLAVFLVLGLMLLARHSTLALGRRN